MNDKMKIGNLPFIISGDNDYIAPLYTLCSLQRLQISLKFSMQSSWWREFQDA